jgi:hypothetical protein
MASLWSVVTVLTAVAFILAMIFTLSARRSDQYNNNSNYNNDGEQNRDDMLDAEMAVTSRAMAFSALWTAVLASLMAVFGTVVLGWQSPTGQYYACCNPSVHRTSPLALGSFIGALLMFANLTLVCSVLFGEFNIRDYRNGDERWNDQNNNNNNNNNNNQAASAQDIAVARSSMAFSIMCMFLTILYAGFAALTYAFSTAILEELAADEREEAYNNTRSHLHHHKSQNHFVGGFDGYIGERFDVRRTTGPTGFVAPKPTDMGTMA